MSVTGGILPYRLQGPLLDLNPVEDDRCFFHTLVIFLISGKKVAGNGVI
jgi:hypothetical protein